MKTTSPPFSQARIFVGLILLQALLAVAAPRPNIILMMSDDMGYSDLGCYGGEIRTPNLDRLAGQGLRFTQFYNTGRCCPTRASLLTGLYPHQAGIGHMVYDGGKVGYEGELNQHCVTIAEVLRSAGYRTYAVGKWHVSKNVAPEGPRHAWPLQRGFDRFYGTITGAGSFFDPGTLTRDNTAISPFADPEYRPEQFYYTDAISDHAVRFVADHAAANQGKPFFMYVAYTAAHWPMHALERDIAKYRGTYDAGYQAIRQARLQKAQHLGVIDPAWPLTAQAGDWAEVEPKAWEARCMEVYAAMIDNMDQGIGRLIAQLQTEDLWANTLLFFLQDNGGCAEGVGRQGDMTHPDKPTLPPLAPETLRQEVHPKQNRDGIPTLQGPNIMPGPEDTYIAYGRAWANVSNTPFREYKHWVHEGGIATPLIVHWPQGIPARGELRHEPGHLIDIMATCVDVADASYPQKSDGHDITPPEGLSLVPVFAGEPLDREAIYWEHEGNRAMREGPWKLVAKGPQGQWELYDMTADRTEMNNLAAQYPERLTNMIQRWEVWARRAHVLPWIWKPAYGEEPVQVGSSEMDFELKPDSQLSRENAPRLAGRAFNITVPIVEMASDGVLVAQGGSSDGFALYLKEGHLCFALRRAGELSLVRTSDPLAMQSQEVSVSLGKKGQVRLLTGAHVLVSKKLPGPLGRHPIDGLEVGQDAKGAVGEYEAPNLFAGRLGTVKFHVNED